MSRVIWAVLIGTIAATSLAQGRVEGPQRQEGPRRQEGPVRTVSTADLARGDATRMGGSRYGSSHNRTRSTRFEQPFHIERPRFEEVGALGVRVLRCHQIRPIQVNCRIGYVFYDPLWCDDRFTYPYYRFAWDLGAVFSPWYYYPHLPGYVTATRIRWGGSRFDVDWRHRFRRDRSEGLGQRWERDSLSEAIDDFERGFERRDRRTIGAVAPRRGQVLVDLDQNYRYLIDAADFYDLLADLVETTRTVRYRVIDSGLRGDVARIVARHEFEDPWGRIQSLTHEITLYRGRAGYEIVEFAVRR